VEEQEQREVGPLTLEDEEVDDRNDVARAWLLRWTTASRSRIRELVPVAPRHVVQALQAAAHSTRTPTAPQS